jgi:hypothetical protein
MHNDEYGSIYTRTVKVGTFKTLESMLVPLKAGFGCEIVGADTPAILKKISLSKLEKNLDIVVVQVKHLGFPDGAKYKDIVEAAKKQGFEQCPAEVGPQLCLQFVDQPTTIHIAMEPIPEGILSDPMIFYVMYSFGKFWLGSTKYAELERPFDGQYRFVFVGNN